MNPISPAISVPQAPTFSLATLRAVLAELTAEHPARQSRLVKAANIVAIRGIDRYPHGGIWFVESESEAGKLYTLVPTPGGDTCDCMDFKQRGGPCKHALAIELLQRCERRDAEVDDPTTCTHGEYGPIRGECHDDRGQLDDADSARNVIAFPVAAPNPDDRFVLTPKGYAALAVDDTQPRA
jgi:hypothetical protein